MEEATLPASDLPFTLWVEIFHKLPLISVGRCLRVCKQWYLLISDPFFVSNYNPNSIRNHPISLLMKCWCNYRLPPNPVPPDLIFLNEAFNNKSRWLEGRPFRSHCDFFAEGQRGGVTVLGTCNGLVALYKSPGDFLLFNPCTKVEKRLQLDSDQSKEIHDLFPYILLCALYQYHDEARGDEYKVLMCDYTWFRILSLKDGSFTSEIQSQVLQDVKLWGTYYGQGWQATMVRGVPHWAGDLRVGEGVVIVYFDPRTEELQMVGLPKARASTVADADAQFGGFELGALDGQLTVAVELGQSYEVWALKEYGDEPCWSMLFVIPKACESFQILSRVGDDEILLCKPRYLKVYNIRTRRWREVVRQDGFHKIMNYIPSLVSPNH